MLAPPLPFRLRSSASNEIKTQTGASCFALPLEIHAPLKVTKGAFELPFYAFAIVAMNRVPYHTKNFLKPLGRQEKSSYL